MKGGSTQSSSDLVNAVVMSSPFKILFRGTVTPIDEVTQPPKTSGAVQENMEFNMYGILSQEPSVGQSTDFGEEPLCSGEDHGRICHSSQPADERGEDEDGFLELDLSSSLASRTILDLKVSVCKASTTGSPGRAGHIPVEISAAGGVPVDNDLTTVQVVNLEQTRHVTEVLATDVDAPSVVTVASECSEHDISFSLEEAEYIRKVTSWFCPLGKSPFKATLLVFCYLLIGVLFFPIFLVVLMVCFVSYFTPDIDD